MIKLNFIIFLDNLHAYILYFDSNWLAVVRQALLDYGHILRWVLMRNLDEKWQDDTAPDHEEHNFVAECFNGYVEPFWISLVDQLIQISASFREAFANALWLNPIPCSYIFD